MRTPAAIDLDHLLASRGPVEARRDLEIRVISDPRDVAGRLALAALDEHIGRPTEAIGALEQVEALGGPLGVRWHPGDRARLARLIAARGRVRLQRRAATALADLERARDLGADITAAEFDAARAAQALTWLCHTDAELRADGRRILAALADPAWRGARPAASPSERGQFGAWLWQQGARRAAWDELSAWHAAAPPPREPALQAAYLAAARWWTPLDLPPPPPDDLVGPARCAFTRCAPRDIVGDDLAERAYLGSPLGPPARDPDDAAALAAITLHQALRGEASWGAALAARVDLTAFREPAQRSALPRYVQPLFARLAGIDTAIPNDATSADQRLILAAERLLAGVTPTEATAGLVDAGPPSGFAEALLALVSPRAAPPANPRAEAVIRHVQAQLPTTTPPESLRAIVLAYSRDPAIGDRLGRDAVAGAADAAIAHATLGAVFDALGDPARARASWQAAVDASAEPAFVRGLAEAQARQGDGDAALINATTAAAAAADPAAVWVGVAQALAGSGRYVQALDAARSAIDLAGPETLAAALEAAGAASRALGRADQAAALDRRRAQLGPGRGSGLASDPTDPDGALDAYRQAATPTTIDRLWIAAQWNPRNVAVRAVLLKALAGDPRRDGLVVDLIGLAGDREPQIRRAAVAALR